jgi:hypothetical protein
MKATFKFDPIGMQTQVAFTEICGGAVQHKYLVCLFFIATAVPPL